MWHTVKIGWWPLTSFLKISPLIFFLSNTLKLFGQSIVWPWAYQKKVILETCQFIERLTSTYYSQVTRVRFLKIESSK
jgi:hypothetical protein